MRATQYRSRRLVGIFHSKFVTPDSVRLDMKISDSEVDGLAFKTPEGHKVAVLYNRYRFLVV